MRNERETFLELGSLRLTLLPRITNADLLILRNRATPEVKKDAMDFFGGVLGIILKCAIERHPRLTLADLEANLTQDDLTALGQAIEDLVAAMTASLPDSAGHRSN